MNLTTLCRFLLGSRSAIVDVASSRGSLALGGLFVMSAGFAREYDGEDLLHEPWHLLLPAVASIGSSFLLFLVLFGATRRHATIPVPFGDAYRRFLSLYWMTAPLAWLYAIPVEQFLSAANAVRVNLLLLGVVSLWRVVLITRCAAVLYGCSHRSAFVMVMFFADCVALALLFFTPLPVINIMGGIRLTESEAVIRDLACTIQAFGTLSWPIWLIAVGVVYGMNKRNWTTIQFNEIGTPHVSAALWLLSAASILIWVVVLPISQPAQRLRHEVEEQLRRGEIVQAIRTMSAHDRSAFPPHWDPPPRPGYGQNEPPLRQVMTTLTSAPAVDWVIDIYLDKLSQQLQFYFWQRMDSDTFDETMTVLESLPEGHEFVGDHADTLSNGLRFQSNLSPEQEARMRALLEAAGVEVPPPKSADATE